MLVKYVIKIVSIIFLSLIFVSMRGESAYAAEASSINVKYQAHVQRIGWQSQVKNNSIAGTTGKALRLEALKINVDTSYSNVKIKYRTHVQRRGWLPYVYNGQVSGTTGQELRVEAIQIKLEGAPAGYHVQYQVHIQGKGWTSWVQDGQVAGTTGQYRRLEAVRIKISAESLKMKTIVLDAGHGGSDPGAIGNGYKEKDLNMQVIQKLGTKLKALGFNVLYTRQPGKDVYVSLQGRAKYANDKNADLFLSIHHDSNTSGSASGTSTHYSSFRPGVETSGAYVTIKAKRYSVIKEVDGIIYYKDGTATKTVSVNDATAYDATPSEAAKKSEELAKELVDVLSDLGVADKGSRDHNLYVTRWTKMPSVLVEMGFVSNKSEIKKIADPAYQDKAAQKMADIIYKFFNK